MLGAGHEQSGCEGGGNREQIREGTPRMVGLADIYWRLWRLDCTVRRFLALCKKKSSIQNGPPLLGRASSAKSIKAYNENGASSPSSTVPLLQSEDFENGDASEENEISKQISTDNGSPSVSQRLQSKLSRASSSLSQVSIDSKTAGIGDHGAPSPSTVPLLQSNGASSTGSNSAMDVHRRTPSSTGSNLTLYQNSPSSGTGSPPAFRVRKPPLRRLTSPARQSQSAMEPKNIYKDEAPSPSSTVPLLHSGSGSAHVAVDVRSHNPEELEELQKEIPRIFDEKDVNLLQESGWAEKLALAFGSHLEYGRNTGSGESVVTYEKQVLAKDFPRFFIRACNRYTIFLLIISACFSLIFEMVEKSPKKGWRDGAAIFVAVLLIVTADSVSGFRRARKQEMKRRAMKVTAIRNRLDIDVPIYSIVQGDLLRLKRDQTIPADGLLVGGSIVVDSRSDKNIDCHRNPFLFSGSTVVGGEGRMLVTSVGGNAVSFKEALLDARISKPNTYAEFFSLCMALLIVLVLFLRFLRRKHDHDDDDGSSQIKGEVTVQGVLKIFEKMFLKPRGTISVLTSSLAAVVIGIQHGMPFVISISLAYWNEKKATEDVEPQNLCACGTMGLVTVICIDISGGLIGEEEEEDSDTSMKEAVENFISEGVGIKLISGDHGLSALTDIVTALGVHTAAGSTVKGQDIRNLRASDLKSRANGIKVMENFLSDDKISMVQCLKELGHVVAFYGARDALVLKAADVGISDKKGTQMAKESSDIIISSYKSLNSLIPICRYGRWAYYNIQKFIQLQLTVMVSSLVITSVATMALEESPITLIQLIWVNLITSILGGLMLVTEPNSSRELDALRKLGNRNEPVITKARWVCVLTQILYQASVLLVFLFKGRSIPGIDKRIRKAMIFNTFALCQFFNYGNAMDLEKKWSNGVKQKGFLLAAVGAAVAVQVVVAEIWARLNLLQWGFCFLVAALSGGLGLGMKILTPFMPDWSFSYISSHLRQSGWIPSRHDFCSVIFSSLFFLF